MKTIKCVVVGDCSVGKTCLLFSYTTKEFPTVYDFFELHHCDVTDMAGEPCTLCLFDTQGREDFDRLRQLNYTQAGVFLVCFSVVSPSTFENAKYKWVPEITYHQRKTPFLLVGTQIDLRDDPDTMEKLAWIGENPVTLKQGEKLAKELKAVKYIECSARTQEGLKKVFDEAVLAALKPPKPAWNKECVLL